MVNIISLLLREDNPKRGKSNGLFEFEGIFEGI
jgi:hypothetical protein